MPQPQLPSGLVALSLLAGAGDLAAADALGVYREHSASCHGAARPGGMGPAPLPENLERLRREDAAEVIAHRRVATQMPAFGDQLDETASRRWLI